MAGKEHQADHTGRYRGYPDDSSDPAKPGGSDLWSDQETNQIADVDGEAGREATGPVTAEPGTGRRYDHQKDQGDQPINVNGHRQRQPRPEAERGHERRHRSRPDRRLTHDESGRHGDSRADHEHNEACGVIDGPCARNG